MLVQQQDHDGTPISATSTPQHVAPQRLGQQRWAGNFCVRKMMPSCVQSGMVRSVWCLDNCPCTKCADALPTLPWPCTPHQLGVLSPAAHLSTPNNNNSHDPGYDDEMWQKFLQEHVKGSDKSVSILHRMRVKLHSKLGGFLRIKQVLQMLQTLRAVDGVTQSQKDSVEAKVNCSSVKALTKHAVCW